MITPILKVIRLKLSSHSQRLSIKVFHCKKACSLLTYPTLGQRFLDLQKFHSSAVTGSQNVQLSNPESSTNEK